MVAGRGEVELHLHRGKAGRRGINTQRGGALEELAEESIFWLLVPKMIPIIDTPL